MAEKRLTIISPESAVLPTSAPLESADFSFFEGTNLLHPEVDPASIVAEPDYYVSDEPEILNLILDQGPEDAGVYIDALANLQNHMSGLLYDENDWYFRRQAAALYADRFHSDLENVRQNLGYNQESALVLSKVYLSSVSSIARMGQFVYTRFWTRKRSEDSRQAKDIYLVARKKFQDDVDDYFDHFSEESSETVCEVLHDTLNMSRLLVNKRSWVDSSTATYNHIFLGSVLSERAVKVGLMENGYPTARYGSVEEDKTPTKADVVVPLPNGDMHVQVKMKWTEPTEFNVRPDKRPLHVIVPMHIIRGALYSAEKEKLATSFDEEVDKLAA